MIDRFIAILDSHFSPLLPLKLSPVAGNVGLVFAYLPANVREFVPR
jgi:hypothetical protein